MIDDPCALLEASRGWFEIKEALSSGAALSLLRLSCPAMQEMFVRKFGEQLFGRLPHVERRCAP